MNCLEQKIEISFFFFIPQYQSLYTFLGLFINNKTATEYVDMIVNNVWINFMHYIYLFKTCKDSNSKFNYINSILLIPFLVVAPIFYLRHLI